MKIFPFRAHYPEEDLIASVDSFLSKVKEQYREFSDNGFFRKASDPAFYLYEIRVPGGKSYKGILGSADVEEYLAGNIAVHEHTISDKEQQQMELILQRHAMVKPLLLCFKGSDEFYGLLDKLLERSTILYSVQLEDQSTHIFHQVSLAEDVEKLKNYFTQKVPKVYIADGHHRAAATARLYKKYKKNAGEHLAVDSMMAGFFPYDELEVHDYNRVIEILNSISPTLLLVKLSQYMHISPLEVAAKPGTKGELTMYVSREWYRLKWKEEVLADFKKSGNDIDYHIFNEVVLKEILGIEDVRMDYRIKYVEGPAGIQGVIDRSQKNDLRVAFCLYPLQLENMVSAAERGETLPPKSTWFVPRIKNGLIVQEV